MAVKEKGLFQVAFAPEGKQVAVPGGMVLVEAAARAGILIDTPCGGQGRCGRCQVKLERGEASYRENPHLTPQQIEQGWVLSCQARVAADLEVTVPPQRERERLAVEATAASRTALPIQCYFPRYPALRQVFVKMEPPRLEDNVSDADRLQQALSQQGVDSPHLELSLMRELSRCLREGQWRVTAVVDSSDGARLIDLHPGRKRGPLLAVAVDIGTTNVVADLVDMRSGKVVEQLSARNRQLLRGEDVISRIIYSERGGLEELHRLVVETVNELVGQFASRHRFHPREVEEMVVAGNTTMVHLFLGLPPQHIREEPYVPTATSYPVVRAGELGLDINPLASVYCLPAVAAYVGGDITAGMLSSCLFRADHLSLFLDVGTNGEIVLGNQEWLTTCACSAGPAFEGAGVKHGMRAIAGAIEEVRLHSTTLEPTLRVVGEGRPQGICGSGMISALAEMHLTGVVDRAGRIKLDFARERMGQRCRARLGEHGPEFVLAWAQEAGLGQDIVITEVDINNIIRTKAAIYAGIAVMARALGIALADIDEVLIGGAFGQHINVEEAIQIGLLPDLPWDRFKFLGNTSLGGAYNALLSRHARAQAEEVAGKMTYFELIADNSFMDEFSAGLFLPHTNIDNFPSVKAALETGSRPQRGGNEQP